MPYTTGLSTKVLDVFIANTGEMLRFEDVQAKLLAVGMEATVDSVRNAVYYLLDRQRKAGGKLGRHVLKAVKMGHYVLSHPKQDEIQPVPVTAPAPAPEAVRSNGAKSRAMYELVGHGANGAIVVRALDNDELFKLLPIG